MENIPLAEKYHQELPPRIRQYLNDRGITDPVIDTHLLGWNGWRITLPIFNREGKLAFFKLAKDPDDKTDNPKMLIPHGASAELYGWEQINRKTEAIIICEGEFDRLVLEAQGFAAVTSTGGAGTFRPQWAEVFRDIPRVYICFDRDEAGQRGAERIGCLIPHARIVRLPGEVGEGGDVTDFFVRLGKTRDEFAVLLGNAQTFLPLQKPRKEMRESDTPRRLGESDELRELKSFLRIEDFASGYLELQVRGANYIAHCPFHEDHRPSFVIYPQKQNFHCYGCGAHGDVIDFLMRTGELTFYEAVKVLREQQR